MNDLKAIIDNYLVYCEEQKRLNVKTLKAYRIDLKQFLKNISSSNLFVSEETLESYIASLHKQYKPKTVKRKIASLKALFRYMEYKNYIVASPFNKLQIRFREPIILPKTIPLKTIERLLSVAYKQYRNESQISRKNSVLRDIAVIELLFATGMRISELCSLKPEDLNKYERTILIFGKGAKERLIQIGNESVYNILMEYYAIFENEIINCKYLFVNNAGRPLTDQSVRRMLVKYSSMASIDIHITPHMFRHTFATSLLEADVDIRYIQRLLGHSSISITELYTHVAMAKQRDILATKHPRNELEVKDN